MRTLRSFLAIALIPGVAGACSADAAPEPEPTFRTPGAFLAARNAPNEYTLARTLDQLPLTAGQDLLVVIRYAPVVESLAAARALAQSPSIPVQDGAFVIPASELGSDRWQVVWFRSLSEAEKEPL
jgi:hypothetical protein